MTEKCCSPKPDEQQQTSCCASKEPWHLGLIETPAGTIRQISTTWGSAESWGQFKCRFSNFFRDNYSVAPGLYAIGTPGRESPVFVSANYKLSFDILRRDLDDLDAWILVLDTKGINVWCAAGKGTFGTEELIYRIKESQLAQVVDHRHIIVPQLGAPGIHAHIVKKESEFRVKFGPAYTKDIKKYIKSENKADPSMRLTHFNLIDRLVLTPMEITMVSRQIGFYIVGVLLFFGLQPQGILFKNALTEGSLFLISGLMALFTGAFLTPLLLPIIPFRSFAIKGLITGILGIGVLDLTMNNLMIDNIFIKGSMYLLFPAISSYLALNFTGCTTFTNQSGVVREMKIGIPIYFTVLIISALLLIAYKLNDWGIV